MKRLEKRFTTHTTLLDIKVQFCRWTSSQIQNHIIFFIFLLHSAPGARLVMDDSDAINQYLAKKGLRSLNSKHRRATYAVWHYCRNTLKLVVEEIDAKERRVP